LTTTCKATPWVKLTVVEDVLEAATNADGGCSENVHVSISWLFGTAAQMAYAPGGTVWKDATPLTLAIDEAL
jgi:hypothetical protein